jgi:polyphenol oxidase
MKNNLFFYNFSKFPDILIDMSLRPDKNMKAYYDFGKDEEALINRERFLEKLNLSGKNLVSVKSISGSNIQIVTEADLGNFIENTDGLITARKNVFLSITIADCLPVIIYDFKKEVIGLLHCGWKGIEKNIIGKALNKMKDSFDSAPQNIIAGIGPGIGNCHFEVKEDLVKKFSTYHGAFRKEGAKSFMDLKLVAQKKLEDCGIPYGSINTNFDCTYCQPEKYFSFRKDKSQPLQAMLVVAGIKEMNQDSICASS